MAEDSGPLFQCDCVTLFFTLFHKILLQLWQICVFLNKAFAPFFKAFVLGLQLIIKIIFGSPRFY